MTRDSMKIKIDEIYIAHDFVKNLKQKVFERLNLIRVERQRERIMRSIVSEKHE